ncbi:beta-ketoacyl-ACP synthase III [Vibrio gazogenes]|uniref:Beta-ketoacyl-[acyl-carrier-protein] synthase III n=1 Tax=Vibrio gazogenes DSM 21264 = NBRC 103151 TaxID=1123492 RepID=A0A1M5CKR7_VIBGA|nr:beta-ketoacyl-ACP synthase III [Vibrio gazogenes]USP14218.1 ketoacyl-ACP synthase III [Vibrio gazogenes]SHF55300.1 3-oxoacyl-[acyl-carrier-protein] synthase-3 [Vibrio gazogenes DSM 21264] [Vibrio gazogenes DSM 21264 = NBRC 103151]SJN53717.1 3-oxoacyl-[acyl-carrier-protein] synthase 3 protein 1 [Vibrio gazogenes]
MYAKISGLGAALPSNKILNEDISSMLETSDHWISTRTGIKSRYFSKEGESTGDLAYFAAKEALSDNDLDNIDLLVLATSTPDRLCPATAPKVAARLNLNHIAAFDINAACSGFIYALQMAKMGIESGTYRSALVIGADTYSTITNPNDRTTYPLFGDGAGAILLNASEHENDLIDITLGSDGEFEDLITIENGGSESKLKGIKNILPNYFSMSGKEVFLKAIDKMKVSVESILSKNNILKDEVDFLIPHQANMRIINTLKDTIGFKNVVTSISLDEYGNTSAASIPLAMTKSLLNNEIDENTLGVMTAFGGGITWGSALVRSPSIGIKVGIKYL